MQRLKAWLIRLLGGERRILVPHRVVEYNGLGRPFEMSDWERLATSQSWGQEFYRYIGFELQRLDTTDRQIPVTAEHDRERVASGVRRMIFNDLSHLADTAAAKVTQARNKAEEQKQKKGLNNHGR